MPHADQVIEGVSGFRLKLLRTAAEIGGELLEMEASYRGGGMPPAHLRSRQAEHFEAVKEAVSAVKERAGRRSDAGDTIDGSLGTPPNGGRQPGPHALGGPPPLRAVEFLERLYGDSESEMSSPSSAPRPPWQRASRC